jgi:hypothetical protein
MADSTGSADDAGSEDAGTEIEGQAEGKAETFERPDFLDEKFFNTKTGEADIESLSKSYSELGTKIREKTEVTRKEIMKELEADKIANRPENPESYELRVTDELQAQMGDDMTFEFSESDPLVNFWRSFSHEAGFSQEQFDEGISAFVQSKFSELPSFDDEVGKLGDNGRDRAQHVNQWATKNLSPETYKALADFAVTADGVMALEEIMRNSGEPAFSPGGPAGTGSTITVNELRQMQADERYWHPTKMDPEFVKKVDAGYEKLVS